MVYIIITQFRPICSTEYFFSIIIRQPFKGLQSVVYMQNEAIQYHISHIFIIPPIPTPHESDANDGDHDENDDDDAHSLQYEHASGHYHHGYDLNDRDGDGGDRVSDRDDGGDRGHGHDGGVIYSIMDSIRFYLMRSLIRIDIMTQE